MWCESALSHDADTCYQKDAIAGRESTAVGDGELDRLQDKTCQFHYEQILMTLKNCLEQPYIWAGCNQAQVDDRKIRDFRDRTIWQNRVVKNNEMFIRYTIIWMNLNCITLLAIKGIINWVNSTFWLVTWKPNIGLHWQAFYVHLHSLVCPYTIQLHFFLLI